MGAEVRPVAAIKVIKALAKLGFMPIRQKGSHIVLKHADGRLTVVPMHSNEDIGRGMLLKIIRDSKVSREDFLKILGGL